MESCWCLRMLLRLHSGPGPGWTVGGTTCKTAFAQDPCPRTWVGPKVRLRASKGGVGVEERKRSLVWVQGPFL